MATHIPVTFGALCGKKPTPAHASEYSDEAPTCEPCIKLRTSAEAATRRQFPWAFAPAGKPATPKP